MLLFSNELQTALLLHFAIERLQCKWLPSEQRVSKSAHRWICRPRVNRECLAAIATKNDFYMALAYTVRDRQLHRWINTIETYLKQKDTKVVCYLSAEFLLGPRLGNGLINLGIYDQGDSGWLAKSRKCRHNGWRLGDPWELPRPESAVDVNFGGHTEAYTQDQGRYRVRWIPGQVVRGVPHDMPILGYKVNAANTLRLWKAEAPESFNFQEFNLGVTENITKVLYPNDEPIQGKQLRLEQQYFFVSCSLQDMIRIHLDRGKSLDKFHEAFAVQLNDTHPSIGVAELMRLLVDEHQIAWDAAWEITCNTFAYTNHTLLPEALEKWPVSLFGSLLPRHLEIIYEINHRFLDEVRLQHPNDTSRVARMSLIDESDHQIN